MEKKKVIELLCEICTKVGEKVFNNKFAHDCFCGNSPWSVGKSFQFEKEITDFITTAVDEKIKKEGGS